MINNVNNVPDYATEFPVWVARLVDGEYWFYGAYENDTQASKVAMSLGADLIYNE